MHEDEVRLQHTDLVLAEKLVSRGAWGDGVGRTDRAAAVQLAEEGVADLDQSLGPCGVHAAMVEPGPR
ncbi:Uncharacterised protein [Nocardia farcinica]|uniref:Uncharacterized protein n=1 Tax=Nocardia farcinica TaxID=37329 RepID=A0A449H1A4_NOCFR|nr:Uncharacterised protein [Nocardia farcinica]